MTAKKWTIEEHDEHNPGTPIYRRTYEGHYPRIAIVDPVLHPGPSSDDLAKELVDAANSYEQLNMTGAPARDEVVERATLFLEARRWEEMGELLADIIIRVHAENPELVANFLTGADSPGGHPMPAPWQHVRNAMEHRLIESPGVLE